MPDLWQKWHTYTARLAELRLTRSPMDVEVRRVIEERHIVAEQIQARGIEAPEKRRLAGWV